MKMRDKTTTFFSVIIPVYNGEKYITGAIESVLRQSYGNYEIIICDDGSDDETVKLCEKYVDNRCRLIRQEHAGVSAARNLAIKESRGEYLIFLDCDDLLEKDFLLKARVVLQSREAFIIAGYKRSEKSFCQMTNKVYYMTLPKIFELDRKVSQNFKWGTVWGKVFDSDIIKRNSLKFSREYSHGEDTLFVLEYLRYIRQIALLDYPAYIYNEYNEKSLSKKYPGNYLAMQRSVQKLFDNILQLHGVKEKKRDIILNTRKNLVQTKMRRIYENTGMQQYF